MTDPTPAPTELAALLAEAWHDATCPEGAECRARALHADSQRRILPLDYLADVITREWLPEQMARVVRADRAEAWDEGHRDGCEDHMCVEMGHLDRNPYREADR